MLAKSSSIMIVLIASLLIIWAWQNYKYHHQHNPLIANNVINYQNDHRNISRRWDNLDRLRNLSSTRKATQRRKEAQQRCK